MVISDMMQRMEDKTPPFQPFITPKITSYQQKQVQWNETCIKKDALYYQFHSDDFKHNDYVFSVMPDACLNIIIKCSATAPQILFSGISLEARDLPLEPGTTYFGFKPYTMLGFSREKIDVNDLLGDAVDLQDYYPSSEQVLEELVGEMTFEERIAVFQKFAATHLIDLEYKQNFLDYFTVMICSSKGNIVFKNIEHIIGYSQRYSREMFRKYHGISPKQYSQIMRFQNTLKSLIHDEDKNQTEITFENGYYDQAHFIKDFKDITHMTPERFKQEYKHF